MRWQAEAGAGEATRSARGARTAGCRSELSQHIGKRTPYDGRGRGFHRDLLRQTAQRQREGTDCGAKNDCGEVGIRRVGEGDRADLGIATVQCVGRAQDSYVRGRANRVATASRTYRPALGVNEEASAGKQSNNAAR